MKVLMVYCNTPQDNTVPIGITQVIACLRAKGHTVNLFDTTFYHQGFKCSAEKRTQMLHFKPFEVKYISSDMCEDFKEKISQFKPDVIGFSVFEVTFKLLLKLLKAGRNIVEKEKIKVAVGGVQTIFWPELFENVEGIDFISISEAEHTFPELVGKLEEGLDVSNQVGFWVRNLRGWHKNPPQNNLTDINDLPLTTANDFGDRFMMKPMMGRHRKTSTIELSRGCPYKCTYCADPFLADQFKEQGDWYRQKSVTNLDEEYSVLIDEHKPEFIYKFTETFFAAGKKWLTEYHQMYKKYSIPFWTESRPETVTEENARMLADLNCIRFSVGLESGNRDFRRELKRNYTDKRIIEAGKTLKKYNINFTMNLIIGYPYETRKMVFDGIRLLKEIKPNGVSTFIFTPYKGSVLRKVCEDNNMIDPDFVGDDYFQMKYGLRNNTFSEAEILGLYRVLPLYIYFPETRYNEILKAESFTSEGDKIFEKMRVEFYEMMKW